MKNPVYCLVWKLNKEVLGITGPIDPKDNTVEELIPVLPRLVTSTDKYTVFVSNKAIR